MSNFALEMPALTGDVVTQGHADYCSSHGHATHTVGDDVSPWCPRCGASITKPAPVEDEPAPLQVGQAVTVEGTRTGVVIALQPAADSISGVAVARVKLDTYGNSAWFDVSAVAAL